MFSCITPCSKPTADESDEEHQRPQSETPRTKQAAKSITTQLKGIALKVRGQCKPSKGSTSYQRRQPDSDTASEYVPSYVGGASVISTPNHPRGNTHGPTFYGAFVGVPTPPRAPHSTPAIDVVEWDDEDDSQEWLAEAEEGINISFVSLPDGGNDLRRIRFSRDMFDRNLAQRWWIENYDRIMELFNVQSFNGQAANPPALSEDEQGGSHSALTFALDGSSSLREWIPAEQLDQAGAGYSHNLNAGSPSVGPSASLTLSPPRSSGDEPPMRNLISEAEWVEQDEPGVFITIRQLTDGTKHIRRLRFSRRRFESDDAKIWWLENKERVEAQYLR